MSKVKEVWIFHINQRNYTYPDGTKSPSPIWRDHWRREDIVSETSRSWVTQGGRKIPKKGPWRGVVFSREEIDSAAYVAENRRGIADRVLDINDHALLLKVANLVGYPE